MKNYLPPISRTYFDKINLIGQIRDEDIGEKSKIVETYRQRFGARGIVLRDDGKIAIFNKSLKNEFKLPGGVTINYSSLKDEADSELEEIKEWVNNRNVVYLVV